ncbi:diacylglycerol O-acyltransferase 3 [Cornus florida]|uniref:diacylglycerol O-acyltransferase 3 n=1 Tax=Cornus florida TaxID=4283 RepID=UPI00289ECE2B|nr:diacylglycerol O-acyltransferase 3 [Cornus florida]
MEVSGVFSRRLHCFPSAGIEAHSHSFAKPFSPGASIDVGAMFSGNSRLMGCRVSTGPIKISGFSDDGHVKYYYGSSPAIRCGCGKREKEEGSSGTATVKKLKKKMKLLKGLSKDLSKFSDMGFGLGPGDGLVGEVKGKMISEAAELLLGQLQQLQADEKELKRKKKEEKAKLKAAQMQNMVDCEESSDSSSESSDSDCEEVVDMSRLKNKSSTQPIPNEFQSSTQEITLTLPSTLTQEGNTSELLSVIQEATSTLPNILFQEGNTNFEVSSSMILDRECCTRTSTSCSNVGSVGCNSGNSLFKGASEKRIEVCMGGKCKKSGAPALLEEFRRVVGVEGTVVGCKCMGKCRDGPNVRVLNHIDRVEADEVDDSVRTPSNPLCIGVGFEDVGLIVSRFLADSPKDLGLAAAS